MTHLEPDQESLAASLQKLLHLRHPLFDPVLGLSLQAKVEPEWRAKAMMWLRLQGTPMYQGWRQPPGLHDGKCRHNSFVHCWQQPDGLTRRPVSYCEGVVLTPVTQHLVRIELHAWNLRRGHVYDLTLGHSWSSRYLGVAFSEEFLRFCYVVSGQGFNLLENFARVHEYLDNYVMRGP